MNFWDAAMKYWQARSDSERTMLCAAVATALAAALYLFLLEPGLTARRQLLATLPKLRAQVDDMRQQQKEIGALRKRIGAMPQGTDLRMLLQTAVSRASFASSARIDSVSEDKALFLAGPVVFDDWLGWIENLQREFGIRLDGCKINALDLPGLVRIEATFVSTRPSAVRKAQ